MKRFIPCVLAFVCVLALVSDSQAQLFRRPQVKVVVNNNQPAHAVQKVVVQQQKVVQQKVVVQDVQRVQVQKVVVQQVQAVQAYAVQAVQIQPVQAYYQVQQVVQPLAFSSGYNCGQTQQLRNEIEQLRLQVQKQDLQQKLTAPPPK